MAASSKPQIYCSAELRIHDQLKEQLILIADSNLAACITALHRVDEHLRMAAPEDAIICVVPLSRESVLFGYHFDAWVREAGVAIEAAFYRLLELSHGQVNRHREEPVKWVEAQLTDVIYGQHVLIDLWIKRADVKFSGSSDWCAPKWLNACVQRPDGDIQYDRLTAWEREGESRSQEILKALRERFTSSLTQTLMGAVDVTNAELEEWELNETLTTVNRSSEARGNRAYIEFKKLQTDIVVNSNFTDEELLNTYESFSHTLRQVRTMILRKDAAGNPIQIGTDELMRTFAKTKLLKATNREHWEGWRGDFAVGAPPRAIALVHLEGITGLRRGTLKTRMSHARNQFSLAKITTRNKS